MSARQLSPVRGRGLVVALLAFVILFLVACVAGSRMAGFYVRPPFFLAFRALFYLEQGLLAGVVLAALGHGLASLRVPRGAQYICFAAFFAAFTWFCAWGLVRTLFAFELTAGYVRALIGDAGAIQEVGLGVWQFGLIVGGCGVFVAAMSAIAVAAFARAESRRRRRMLVSLLAAFLLVHVPVQTYFTYHINRDQHAVMALEDGMLFCLHSERLAPGLRKERRALPSAEDRAWTNRYLQRVKSLPRPTVPRKYDILYLVVDSLRFDTVQAATMPWLWSHRDEFQVRLDRDHWTGGNTTKWGIFSMLTGIAPCHLQDFFRLGVRYPLLTLLEGNGYRLRIGKKNFLRYAQMEPFLPASTILVDVPDITLYRNDERMVSLFLDDRQRRRPGVPAFDMLMFDATHWPYSFPPEHTVFAPAPPLGGAVYFARSSDEVARAYNGYRNACSFVDSQIARVVEGLRAAGRLDGTIVIVTGDHGQEFQEMGQFTHSAVINDYQARVPLWMHIPPGATAATAPAAGRTSHLDVVPTLLQLLGFEDDILYTQGLSLFEPGSQSRPLWLSEQGYYMPFYHALVTSTHVSRWRETGGRTMLFSGVLRRDGRAIEPGDESWWEEAQREAPRAERAYHLLPDPWQPPRRFVLGVTGSNSPARATGGVSPQGDRPVQPVGR
jgi:uncharacterized protein